MALPDGKTLEACLEFLHLVIVAGRNLAWAKEPSEKIADLLDAVHNLPSSIHSWEEFDVHRFREDLLGFDRKWSKHGEKHGFSLLTLFEGAIGKHGVLG